MLINVEVEVKPLDIPSYLEVINSKTGFPTNAKVVITELSEDTIIRLCEDFCTRFIKQAGKKVPGEIKLIRTREPHDGRGPG